MSAKRNLLLGILALQNNFVNRAQLLTGFNAWVEDKSKSLGDLLLEQKALSPQQHALLEALVAEHLRQHDGDADKSLAALSSAGSAHRHLAKIADADVQESLAALSVGQAPLPVPNDDAAPYSAVSTEDYPGIPGRFRILRPHASGGLGKVSVALDQELKREVALKEIKEQHADNREARSRFLLEAEITGALEHPGIVPVYSLGTYADGRPYYAMRFIKGDSLKEAIDTFHKNSSTDFTDYADKKATGTPKSVKSAKSADRFAGLEFRKLLGRFVDVCNAIAYAHSRGVLHRDLKPGNIMLGKYGETLVVDWGLAKAAGRHREPGASATGDESLVRPSSGSGSSDTLPGSALGTPTYMSPEQAAGRLDQLGPASDVYSLGATLYHLLTGKVPFMGDSAEILKKVKAGDFAPPGRVQPTVPPALESVCLKAMALQSADRYGTARELAEEVERWLADQPVQAWPEPWTVKTRRWTNRHRVLVSSAAACLVVIVAALVIGNVLLSRANADLEDANQTISQRETETKQSNRELSEANEEIKNTNAKLAKSEKEAREGRDHAERLLATSTMMLAKSRFEENQAALAEDLLEQVPAKFRFTGWSLLKNYVTGKNLCTLCAHTEDVTSVAFSPDNQVLASASGDQTVKLWDARSGQELRTLRGHTNRVTSVAFAANGQVLASASEDQTVKLWDARTGQELRVLRGHTNRVTSVAFAADGQVLASASGDQTVKLWDARTGQELRTLSGAFGPVAFAADGQLLASASADNTIKLWDARTGQQLRTLRGHTVNVMSVAFTADGQVLASASGDKTIKLWAARTGQELRTLRGHTFFVASVAFAAEGQVLASASRDHTVKLWDAGTGEVLRTLSGHTNHVASVAFAADGQVLASASGDKTVKLWDGRTGQEVRTLRGHTSWVDRVAFAPDGQVIASASNDKTVKLWDVRTGQELRTLRGHTLRVASVAFASAGQMLASASDDQTVKLWDARTGQDLRTLRGHTSSVWQVAFAPDSEVLGSASRDKTVKLWDARTGQELHTLRGHKGGVMSLAFAADGHVLASAGGDEIKLWDARTGQELRTLRGHTFGVTSVAFAADGQILASASADQTIKLWDTRTGQDLHTLRGHTHWVTSVAFAADGQVLASASTDHTVKLWDARTGQDLRTLRGHSDMVTNVAFAADGQVAASASYDQTIKLWDTRTGQDSENERRFRLWIFAPDSHLHRELAEQADKEKQPFAQAFRLGRYLAAKNYYDGAPHEAATLAGWLGTAAQPPGLLPGLPVLVKTPFHEPTFPDGIACTGVLYKDSNIAPARLLIGTSRALEGDPANWLDHAFHGGALFRKGDHANALAVLTQAAELHGKPSPLTHNLLGLTHLALGAKDKAKDAFAKAQPAKDAPWEDMALQRLLQPEIDLALAKAEGKQDPMEK